jgi:hypothetical protein
MRLRWQSVVPALGTVLGILSDPSVLGILPGKAAHAVVGISAIAAIFFPALLTNKPPSPDPDKQVQYSPPTNRGC